MNTGSEWELTPDEEMEARLWAYIDGISEESQVIRKLVAEQAQWKAKHEELLSLHQTVGGMELEEPSLRFTKNVMEEIARMHIAPAAKNYINSRIVWGIALFFIITFIGFLVYGFSQINWSLASDNSSPVGIDLAKVDYGKMFGNNLLNFIMMVNIVLGLLLIDRSLKARLASHRSSLKH